MLICLLRHKTAKRVFSVLLTRKQLSHSRLAEEVAVTSQALTWQMKTLRNTEFIMEVSCGTKILYSLNPNKTAQITKTLTALGQQ